MQMRWTVAAVAALCAGACGTTAAGAAATNIVGAASAVTNAVSTNTVQIALCGRLFRQPVDRSLLASLHDSLRTLAGDDAACCRYGVVYYLGCLYAGDVPAARRIRPALQRFEGLPEMELLKPGAIGSPCKVCKEGKEEVDCATCHGTGRCPRCRGRGTMSVPGFDNKRQDRPCPTCQGLRDCRDCSAKGKIPRTCSACGGSGERIDGPKLKMAYLRLLGEEAARAQDANLLPAEIPPRPHLSPPLSSNSASGSRPAGAP